MTDITLFTQETAQLLLESDEQYPVDFEIAWVWLGYTRKENATSKLKRNFAENVDYIKHGVLHHMVIKPTGQGFHHRPTDSYYITVDCLKDMGMMVGTEKGKQIRTYFRECEKMAQQFVKNYKNLAIAASLANKLSADYQELVKLSTFYANEFVQSLNLPVTPQTSQNDLEASLVANRLGLAFNKHIKAFQEITDVLSPETFNTLKEQYQSLAEDYSNLLKTKTPKPVVEYVDRYHEVEKIVYHQAEMPVSNYIQEKLNTLESQLFDKTEELSKTEKELLKAKKEIQLLRNIVQDQRCEITHPQSGQIRPSNPFMLPPAK